MDLIPISVEHFVSQSFATERVHRIVSGWRVESDLMQKIVIKHIREMGIYMVPGSQRELLMGVICDHLVHSPEINALVKKAEAEETKRQQNRHST